MTTIPAEHPLVIAAGRLAADLLAPAAERVDGGTVPSSHLVALAEAGLFGILAPTTAGGSAASPAVLRQVTEILAGADLSTWFVFAQHHSVVRAVAASGRRPDLLAELAAGRVRAGIAFSHLRRFPRRPVQATRVSGGWRFDGGVPWYTGWGLNQVLLLGGATEHGEVVLGLLPAVSSPELTASQPLRLAALQATLTVGLTVSSAVVPDRDVIDVRGFQPWADADRRIAVNANPAVFGVAGRALQLLAEHATGAGEPAAGVAAERIGDRLGRIRSASYALADAAPSDRPLTEPEATERLALRAAAHQACVRATTALVLAGAGRSMSLASPAQRLAREAMFLLVQAQTAEARRAALAAWAEG